jgi:hypothetical protein
VQQPDSSINSTIPILKKSPLKLIAMTPKSHAIPISVHGDTILTLRNPTDKHLRGIQDYEVKYRFCSLTLRGVSPYFRAIFKHSFAEATPQGDGMLHLCVEGFHSRAMIILLKFLHGHEVITHRALSLGDLVNIAIIVDYYAISIASLARYSRYGATYFQEAVVRLIGGRVDSWDFCHYSRGSAQEGCEVTVRHLDVWSFLAL